jgi:hypothetical protein
VAGQTQSPYGIAENCHFTRGGCDRHFGVPESFQFDIMAEIKGCKGCGAPFDPANNKNPDSPYCSMELGLAEYAGLMKKDVDKADITHECKRCGEEFFESTPQDLCFKCGKEFDSELSQIAVLAGMKTKEDKADEVLKDKGSFFQRIKEKIRMARKARMRTVQMLLCDSCDNVILQPEDGYIVHGNIYVADPESRGGLIGNNFPEEEGATVDQVTQQVFCKKCFTKALETTPKPTGPTPRKSRSSERDAIMGMEQQDIPF